MSDTARVDVWLWRARFFKTRSLAAHAVAAGGVRLTRQGVTRVLTKQGAAIGLGDRLTIATPGGLAVVVVVSVGARRGPATEARTLYIAAETVLDDGDGHSHISGAESSELGS